MKLPIIVSAGMISATVAYNAYALTCGAQPSCDSLGYEYTGATTDCLNEPLKCPFNSSYFNCTKKSEALAMLQEDIITAAMPDYSKMQQRSNNITYTAQTNGFIVGFDRFISNGYATSISISINGRNVRINPDQSKETVNSWSYPVKKGAKYQVNQSNAEITYYFIPTI